MSLAGKTIVFTGTLSVTRNEARALAVKTGANISDTVNSRTDYLVAGTDPGSKLIKAKKLGIEILSGNDFLYYTRSTTLPPYTKKIEKKRIPPIKKVEIKQIVGFPELDLD